DDTVRGVVGTVPRGPVTGIIDDVTRPLLDAAPTLPGLPIDAPGTPLAPGGATPGPSSAPAASAAAQAAPARPGASVSTPVPVGGIGAFRTGSPNDAAGSQKPADTSALPRPSSRRPGPLDGWAFDRLGSEGRIILAVFLGMCGCLLLLSATQLQLV